MIARAYGLQEARFSVFPTSLFLTIARGEAATIEPTKRLSATPRLDQIAAVHRLAEEAERGALEPADGHRAARADPRHDQPVRAVGERTRVHDADGRDRADPSPCSTRRRGCRSPRHHRRRAAAARARPALARSADALRRCLRRRRVERACGEARDHRSRPPGDDRGTCRLHPRRGADDGVPRAGRGPDDLRLQPTRLGRDPAGPDCVRHRRGRRAPRIPQSAPSPAPTRSSAAGRPGWAYSSSASASRSPIRRHPVRCRPCSLCSTPRGPARSLATRCSAPPRAASSGRS